MVYLINGNFTIPVKFPMCWSASEEFVLTTRPYNAFYEGLHFTHHVDRLRFCRTKT